MAAGSHSEKQILLICNGEDVKKGVFANFK